MSVLHAENLSATYRDGDRSAHVLQDVSLSIEQGQMYSIAGRSGSGKTTLLSMLLGLVTEREITCGGSVWFRDQPIRTAEDFALLRRDSLVYVSQSSELVGFLTVMENMRLSEALGGKASSVDACRSALSELGVGQLEDRLPSQISGGERQRCAIARCLARSAPLLVVDEPTSSLDDESAELVVSALLNVREAGTAVIAASHDSRIAATADISLSLSAGRLECS